MTPNNVIIKYDAKALQIFTAKVCADFIKDVGQFYGDFGIQTNSSTMIDARSILGLFSLTLDKGQYVVIYANIHFDDNGKVTDFLSKYFDLANNEFHDTESDWFSPLNVKRHNYMVLIYAR